MWIIIGYILMGGFYAGVMYNRIKDNSDAGVFISIILCIALWPMGIAIDSGEWFYKNIMSGKE